jgi:acetyltransferase-like isoleucine patch superfamily enzyme
MIGPSTERELPLINDLRKLWRFMQVRVNKKWHRTLPFGDYIIDRWEKAEILGFGARASIYDSSLVIGDVNVGENTWIGPFTILDGSGGLKIGAYCSISAGVQIYTHDSVKWAVTGGTMELDRAPVTIGDRCYIGPNSVITKGVKIGDGCIIGANSLVLDDIPSNSKAFGTPCRIVGGSQ